MSLATCARYEETFFFCRVLPFDHSEGEASESGSSGEAETIQKVEDAVLTAKVADQVGDVDEPPPFPIPGSSILVQKLKAQLI